MATKAKFQAIRGTRDLLPPETALWNRVEQAAHEVFATFGFGEIRLPIFEPTDLFARSIGADTDVVSKEMYSFPDPPENPYEYIQTLLQKIGHEKFANMPDHERDAYFSEIRERQEVMLVTLRPEATASVCRAYIEHSMQQLPQPLRR